MSFYQDNIIYYVCIRFYCLPDLSFAEINTKFEKKKKFLSSRDAVIGKEPDWFPAVINKLSPAASRQMQTIQFLVAFFCVRILHLSFHI